MNKKANRNPTVRQVERLIKNLEMALPQSKKVEKRYGNGGHSVAMLEGNVCEVVDIENGCGTPMCHAGWYALSSNMRPRSGSKKINGFGSGALLMARDLGFKSTNGLQRWAEDNREIWGNANGMYMFSSGEAFVERPGRLERLGTIISHWRKVAKRLAKLEAKKATTNKKK